MTADRRYFQINDLQFYPQTSTVVKKGEEFQLRPKTAELLLLLLQAQGGIVSKGELLNNIWGDVLVEEHVIFQSVAELRKLFGESNIIKTHPRKGYSVIASVTEHTNSKRPSTLSIPQKMQPLVILVVMLTLLGSAMFWLGISLMRQAQLDSAIDTLKQASQHAEQGNDLLYLGNISRVLGNVYRSQQQTSAAEQALAKALDYYQAIQCPFGRANTLLDLGELATASGQSTPVQSYYQQGFALANQRGLVDTRQRAKKYLLNGDG